MKDKTSYKEAVNSKIFHVIAQASKELNIDSYVIGGFVRDLLLKRNLKKTSTLLLLEAASSWL